eukprot:TRINITY_DN10604_c1_g1_i1.p1 TRINITY_DN10604_c1_g1~~TRINITY_DN10604_c1_g1_i1.p1  ORF type:complete len:480 (+),score=152.14 TRINITY_DN10604_c1_g1_i1:69-1442(+)
MFGGPSHASAQLLAACKEGSAERAAAALEGGGRLSARGEDGLGPLHRAVASARGQCLAVLLAHAAALEPGELEGRAAPAAAHLAGHAALHCAALLPGRGEMVRQLIAAGADCAARAPGGATPLHCAAFAGRDEPLRLLLEHGADPDPRDEGGATPLLVAAGAGWPQAVRRLLAAGADAAARDQRGLCAVERALAAPAARALDGALRVRLSAHECVYLLLLAGAPAGAVLDFVPPPWRPAHLAAAAHRTALLRGGALPPATCLGGACKPLASALPARPPAAPGFAVPYTSYLTATAQELAGWGVPFAESDALADTLHMCWMEAAAAEPVKGPRAASASPAASPTRRAGSGPRPTPPPPTAPPLREPPPKGFLPAVVPWVMRLRTSAREARERVEGQHAPPAAAAGLRRDALVRVACAALAALALSAFWLGAMAERYGADGPLLVRGSLLLMPDPWHAE